MSAPIRPGDVVVTGLSWATPLGSSLDGAWHRLLAGDTGFRPVPSKHPVCNQLAATVPGLPLDAGPAARQVTLATRTLAAALADANRSPRDSGLNLVLGTSFGAALDQPSPALSDWAGESARRVGHPGEPIVVSTACSAGSDSLLVGAELVRSGYAQAVAAGGVDVLTPAKRLSHTALGTMSADRMRAFDQRHDGMLLGEGAAVLVLERADSAWRRSAPIHAVLRGTGSANDAAGLTAPDPTGDGVALAIRRCLADAGREAGDVAVVSAHATATQLNDDVESAGLRAVFAGHSTAATRSTASAAATATVATAFATKGALGHSLGATGAIEAVSVVLALRERIVPPVAGLERPVPGFPLALPVGGPRRFEGDVGLSLTLGFGGFNTCLLLERGCE